MTIGDVLKALEETKTAALAKEIGVGEKKLRDALRAAGYEYSNTIPKGWHWIREGEQPLEKSIHDYVQKRTTTTNSNPKAKVTPKEDTSNALTTHEVSILREMVNQWETIKNAVNTVTITSEDEVGDGLIAQGVTKHSQQPIHSINELYVRVKQEIEPQKKMRKTLNINSGVGTALDDFATKNKLDKQDIIELALYDFFAAYGADYTDLRKGSDK